MTDAAYEAKLSKILDHEPVKTFATIDSKAAISLDKAAALSGLDVAALRTEAKKGHLSIFRVAGKDHTTAEALQRMFEQCRVSQRVPVCGLGQPAATPVEISQKLPITRLTGSPWPWCRRCGPPPNASSTT